ncbi:MAG: hypothetical protein ABI840_12420, partial [bacterium]
VNQDGNIDISDLALVENAAYNFEINEILDLNCDGIVDLSDYAIVDNNAFQFVSVIKPVPKPLTSGNHTGTFFKQKINNPKLFLRNLKYF